MNFINLNMLSWNVRGLGDLEKCNVVKEYISSSSCDIIFLQETKWDNGNIFQLRKIEPPRFTQVSFLHSSHVRGGTLIACINRYSLLHEHRTTYTNSITISTHADFSFFLTNIYGLIEE